jgi:hypothetical protein
MLHACAARFVTIVVCKKFLSKQDLCRKSLAPELGRVSVRRRACMLASRGVPRHFVSGALSVSVTTLYPTDSICARMVSCTCCSRPIHTTRMQACPAAAARRLLQMRSITTCATPDLLLQHLEKTFATYVQNS